MTTKNAPTKNEVDATLANIAVEQRAKTLADSTMYMKIKFGRIGNSRKVSTSQIEVDADKDFVGVSKKLFKSPELIAIRDHDNETKRHVDSICFQFDVGFRLIPTSAVTAMDEYMERRQAEREKLVEKFIEVYPRLCQEAPEHLRGIHNPNDYLPVEHVRREFIFSWNYVNFGTPDKLKAVSKQIFKREAEKAQREVQQVATEIKDAMRVGLLELLVHLRDKLTPNEDGEKKVLRTGAVKNLQEFLEVFDLRNVVADDDLARVVTQVRSVMNGVDRDALAASDGIRQRVKTEIDAVVGTLDTMVANRPGRKFRKELE